MSIQFQPPTHPGIFAVSGSAGGALATIQAVTQVASATNSTITWPSGILANDYMLLMLALANSGASSAVTTGPPAGFTELTPMVASTAGTRNIRMWVWQKFAAGTESGTTAAPIADSSAPDCGTVGLVLRNVSLSAPIASTASLTGGTSTDPRPTAPTLSAGATNANRWAVLFWAQSEDTTSTNNNPPGAKGTWQEGSGTNYTYRGVAFDTGSGDDRVGAVFTAAMATGETISGKRPTVDSPTGTPPPQSTWAHGWVTRGFVITPKVL